MVEFPQVLMEDILFVENKLFFAGHKKLEVYVMCVDVSNMDILLERQVMDLDSGPSDQGVECVQKSDPETFKSKQGRLHLSRPESGLGCIQEF